MSEWFIVRRGLANGAINAGTLPMSPRSRHFQSYELTSQPGTALGGLLLPLILPPLLNKYSTPRILRSLGITEGIMLLFALPFIRGRLPETRVQGPTARARQTTASSRVYTRSTSFWIIILATLLQGLAYFIPLLWLPGTDYFPLVPRR